MKVKLYNQGLDEDERLGLNHSTFVVQIAHDKDMIITPYTILAKDGADAIIIKKITQNFGTSKIAEVAIQTANPYAWIPHPYVFGIEWKVLGLAQKPIDSDYVLANPDYNKPSPDIENI